MMSLVSLIRAGRKLVGLTLKARHCAGHEGSGLAQVSSSHPGPSTGLCIKYLAQGHLCSKLVPCPFSLPDKTDYLGNVFIFLGGKCREARNWKGTGAQVLVTGCMARVIEFLHRSCQQRGQRVRSKPVVAWDNRCQSKAIMSD